MISSILVEISSEESAVKAAEELKQMIPLVIDLKEKWANFGEIHLYEGLSDETDSLLVETDSAYSKVDSEIKRLSTNPMVWPLIQQELAELDTVLGRPVWGNLE